MCVNFVKSACDSLITNNARASEKFFSLKLQDSNNCFSSWNSWSLSSLVCLVVLSMPMHIDRAEAVGLSIITTDEWPYAIASAVLLLYKIALLSGKLNSLVRA